ncbi:VOC family protein [Xanthobacter tagetidis]|uniref:VOC family protein n=1 Tax=Xanthobacter tagetidis TaxID=60216 RepID=A0A3L7AF30_9HYPH|nr:VOC family protein [Xanthobacter tagetidis]MBB6308613.1 catechol 2,3-dioxygenase [Xanthobacter tagetidis]RLP78625.1 VOC family protein [Xanthobacter tagetidis]
MPDLRPDAHPGDAPALLPDGLALGPVTLRSRDPDALVPFYRAAVGLDVLARAEGGVVLGAGGRPLVEVVRDAAAPLPPARAPGLFHLAVRVPDRAALAARLLAARRLGLRLGASDHLVSEALYLDDPDGNGVEIYRDRPREAWPATEDGTIAMETLPLNLAALSGEATEEGGPAPAGTDMGHVHLKVSDLDAARRFWVDLVGFTVMAAYPGALFVSAGGYHHHLGLNVWHSAGGAPPPKGSTGLDHFEVRLPGDGVAALAGRLAAAGWPFARQDGGIVTADPSGNGVAFRAAG